MVQEALNALAADLADSPAALAERRLLRLER